jgi:autotransporter translocation and assembly factor TamB
VFRRLLGVVTALIAVAIIAAAVVVHTHRFQDFLRLRVVDYLNQTYRGRFAIDQVRGPIFGDLTLRGVRIDYDNSRVMSISAVRLDYELLPLLDNRLSITRLLVESPLLNLAHTNSGAWNLLAALSERRPTSTKSSLSILIYDLTLARGHLAISAPQGGIYEVGIDDIVAAVTVKPAGLGIRIGHLDTSIAGAGLPDLRLAGALSYNEIGDPNSSIRISRLRVTTSNSDLTIGGIANARGRKAVDLTIALKRLAAQDINTILPRVAVGRNISGVLRITGQVPASIRADSEIAAGESRVKTHALANLGGQVPVYDARMELENVNVHELLTGAVVQSLPEGIISGHLRAKGHGTDIAGLNAQTELVDRGVAMKGWQAGDLSLRADVQGGVANVDARLEGKAGRASLNGKIHALAPESFDLQFSASHLNPRTMSPRAPAGDLNAIATLRGVGFEPATTDAAVRVSCQRSAIGPIVVDRGAVQAGIRKGVLHIVDADAQAQGATISLQGRVAFATQAGNAHYVLNVGRLTPWMKLAGLRGGGAVNLAGDASGDPHRMQVSGAAELSQLRLDNYSVRQGRINYDLKGIGKPNSIKGRAMLALSDLHTGVQLKSMQAGIRLEPGKMEAVYLSANAVQAPSRVNSVALSIGYRPQYISAHLTNLSLSTDAGTWQLDGAASIVRTAGKISIRGLRIQNNGQVVTLDGDVSDNGRQDLSAQVQQLRLASLSAMTKGTQFDGVASARLNVSGTAAEPRITLGSDVKGMQVQGIRYENASAKLDYAPARASLAVRLQQDARHWLDATGSLPIRLAWANGFEHRILGDIDLRVRSPGLDAAFLQAFGQGKVRNVKGNLAFDLTVRGPPAHPVPAGFITLTDGQALIRPLGVQVGRATARIALDAQEIQLVNLSASAGQGRLSGEGLVNLRDAIPTSANLKVAFDDWPAINTMEYQAIVAGDVECTGPVNAPHLSGKAEVLRALLRPDLDLMQQQSLQPDHSIRVERSWNTSEQVSNQQNNQGAGSSVYKNMVIDFDTVIERDTWVKNEDAEIALQGRIHVSKTSGSDPLVSGEIKSVRGTLVVAGKTFTLTRAQILLTGGHKIDPSLDVAAKYTAPKYEITANITGTASKPDLTLSSVPSLPQSDILSVLMFGKPADQLSTGEQKGLQNQALSMAGGYAASQLGQAVAQSLGLETLGVGTAEGGVGFGHFLTQNVYISASQSPTSTRGQGASVSFYLTPHLELDTSASTQTSTGNQIELNWEKEY